MIYFATVCEVAFRKLSEWLMILVGVVQGAHPEAVDVEARVHSQDDPDKLEAKRILNAKVSAYTLEAGVILHRCPPVRCLPARPALHV